MALRPIRIYPNSILRQKAQAIQDLNGRVATLIEDMIETMHHAPGIGLAAPQVGEGVRLIVVDLSIHTDSKALIVLVNPVIVATQGEAVSEEGCLSIPDTSGDVVRADGVEVKGFDQDGREISLQASGLLSRVLQHEIDHLDGILYFDRMSKVKRELLKVRLKKGNGRQRPSVAQPL